jgi:hypothetical protein
MFEEPRLGYLSSLGLGYTICDGFTISQIPVTHKADEEPFLLLCSHMWLPILEGSNT